MPSSMPSAPSTQSGQDPAGRPQASSSQGSSAPTPQKPAGQPPAGSPSGQNGVASSPAGSPAAGTRGNAEPAAGAGARTQAERDAEWEQSFDHSLIAFDERLGREQAEIERQAGGRGRGGSGSAEGKDDVAGNGEEPGNLPATGVTPHEAGSGTDAGGEIGTTGSGLGNPTSGPRFPAPEGTPDGRDDDIVAKQLREAAEKETDPQLRAKLWEEYKRYKSRKA
jgi:hypothetical protein